MDGSSNLRGRSARATRSTRRANRGTNVNTNTNERRAQEVATTNQGDASGAPNTSVEGLITGGPGNVGNGPEVQNVVEEMPDAPNAISVESSSSSTLTGQSNTIPHTGTTPNIFLDSDTVPRYPAYNNNRIYASPTIHGPGQTSTRINSSAVPSQPVQGRPATGHERNVVPPTGTPTAPPPGTRRVEGIFGHHDIPINALPSSPFSPPGVGFFQASTSAAGQSYATSGHPNAHREQSLGSYSRRSFGSRWNDAYTDGQQQFTGFAEEQRAMNQAMRNLDQAVSQYHPRWEFASNAPSDGEIEYGERLREYSRRMERRFTEDPAGYIYGDWDTVTALVQRRRAYEEKYREALAIKVELQTLRISLDPISNNLREKAECAGQTMAALQRCQTQAADWRAQAEQIDRDIAHMSREGGTPARADTSSVRTSSTLAENRGLGGDRGEVVSPRHSLPMQLGDRGDEIMEQRNWRSGEGTVRRARAHGLGGYVLPNAGGREGVHGGRAQNRERAALPRRNPRNQDGS